MKLHDSSIISKRDLWDNRTSLGEVVKLITNSGIRGGIVTMFCRSALADIRFGKYSNKLIKKSQKENAHIKCLLRKYTVYNGVKHHPFFSDFHDIFATVCKYVDEYTLCYTCVSLESAPELESTTIIFEILKSMTKRVRTQLEQNNTLELVDYYAIIELEKHMEIPVEYTKKYMLEELARWNVELKQLESQSFDCGMQLTDEAIKICESYNHNKWLKSCNFNDLLRVYRILELLNLRPADITEQQRDILCEIEESKSHLEEKYFDFELPNTLCEFLEWNITEKVSGLDSNLDYMYTKTLLEERLHICNSITSNGCENYRNYNLDDELEKICTVVKLLGIDI